MRRTAVWRGRVTTLQCPSDPYGIGDGTCYRTNGDDLLIGTDRADRIESPKGDDVVRCGDGYDVVPYNKGEDKVAADCEELYPYR